MSQLLKISAFLIGLLLAPTLALAQSAPANLPAQSVYGRLGTPGDTGSGQAIPFSTLFSQFNGGFPIYTPLHPGNAALYFQAPNPPAGYATLYSGFQFSQGPASFPAAQQFGSNNIPIRQGLVGTTQIPVGEVTVQAHGGAFYALANVPNSTFSPVTGGTYSTGNAVGLLGWGGASVNNGNFFGANIIASNTNGDQNAIGKNVNYGAGLEIDGLFFQLSPGVNPTCNQGHCYGLTIAGGSNLSAMIANTSAIVIDQMNVVNGIPWNYGFQTYAGATVNAVVAGPAASGANKDSQYIAFQYSDGSSAPQIGGRIKSDTGGNLLFLPAAGAVVALQDGAGASLLTTSSSFGGGKVRIPAFTTAGVVTNDITTGQLNSVPTLANSFLTNPATTVNGQTCTLGSTCTVVASASSALTFGTHLTSGGASYNGSAPITITSDATNANTASTIVARDGSGNFSAGTITASLTGHASLDLAVSALGTGVQAALGINIGSAGAPVLFNGAGGTPSSIVLTNATGTASGLTAGNASVAPAGTLTGTTLAANVVTSSLTTLGTITSLNASAIGAGTPGTGAFTTLSASSTVSGTGFSAYLASPPAIGGTAAAAGTFTTVTATTNHVSPNGSAGGYVLKSAAAANDSTITQTAGNILTMTMTPTSAVNKFQIINSASNPVFDYSVSASGAWTMSGDLIIASSGISVNTPTSAGAGNMLLAGLLKYTTATTAVSGAGPIAIGSASTLNARFKVNMNGVDYWIPASTTAF